jgi:hypothetical protein
VKISRELFDQQRRPRFGTANPERMQMTFWEHMVRSSEGPCHIRNVLKVPFSEEDGPIWTFDRMGATRTTLPDGRVVCVGGEHEDFYDPDFYIYNDVVVLHTAGQIEIYGYPKEIFPPTDFHTATLWQGKLFIVGCVGYMEARCPGHTPTYVLDLSSYQFSAMQTSGEMPSWISEHHVDLDPGGLLTIRRGLILSDRDGQQRFRRNCEDYTLDLNSGVWRRVTNRNWRQFNIRQKDGKLFVLKCHPSAKLLLPTKARLLRTSDEDANSIRFVMNDVALSLTVGVKSIEVIVEADLAETASIQIAEEIRAVTEAVIQRPCILEMA